MVTTYIWHTVPQTQSNKAEMDIQHCSLYRTVSLVRPAYQAAS